MTAFGYWWNKYIKLLQNNVFLLPLSTFETQVWKHCEFFYNKLIFHEKQICRPVYDKNLTLFTASFRMCQTNFCNVHSHIICASKLHIYNTLQSPTMCRHCKARIDIWSPLPPNNFLSANVIKAAFNKEKLDSF